MTLRIGSLFSGYGGLDLAVQAIYDAEHAWFCEFDPAPSRILAHHWPDVPNLKDVTAVDWATVEPPDILTGGFPCQDVSVAGRRAGMTDGTRSGLWSHMAQAIDALRPGLVVIENVGGLFSAEATRVMESHPLCLGDGGAGSNTVLLRAIDAVLSTLSELGYDAEWTSLRAADVGAPHGRLRVFITAHPQVEPGGIEHGDGRSTADTSGGGSGGRATRPEPTGRHDAPIGSDPRGDRGRDHHRLMPTPRAARMDREDSEAERERRSPGLEAVSFHADRWGDYAPAIARWEHVIGRAAPAPTEPGKTRPRLAAAFVEWLMGLPEGHVTGVGLTRSQELKALGNGVVPQQGAAALRQLHDIRHLNP